MTLRDALTRATSQLAAAPELRQSALADAALLLRHTLGISRAQMMAHPERTVTLDQQASYQALLQRRLRMEPVQYITGVQEFYGLLLRVTPAVLIPRPETELLVERVLAWVGENREQGSGNREQQASAQAAALRIVDVGTGSGAIALALASHLPAARLVAIDCSPEALAVARSNAESLGLAARVHFVESDLLIGLAASAPAAVRLYDAIVSNPPYIPELDRDGLHPQVRDWEPSAALFAGTDGLEVYRRLIPQAAARLRPGGLLALEIGFGQADAIKTLLTGWADVQTFDDLQGIPRVITAKMQEPQDSEDARAAS